MLIYGSEDAAGTYYVCEEVKNIDFDTFDTIISQNPKNRVIYNR